MSESIEFNKPMAQACQDEVQRFCADVPPGDARVIWCLTQHTGKADFGDACKEVRCTCLASYCLACGLDCFYF